MTLALRPYQESLIEQARDLMRRRVRSILIQAPTGSGKTALTAAMLRAAVEKGSRAWFLVHRTELIQQSEMAFRDAGVPHGIIAAGYESFPRWPVQICSVQTLVRRLELVTKPDIIVSDECFPAGTMVGERPIETIRVGDSVPCYDHASGAVTMSRVSRTFRSIPSRMVTVHMDNGRRLVCTPGHPFFAVERNEYVPAESLQRGAVLRTMYSVPRDGNCRELPPPPDLQEDRAHLLFPGLPRGVGQHAEFGSDVPDQQPASHVVIATDAGTKPDEHAGRERTGGGDLESHWACTEGSRWEREGADRPSAGASLGYYGDDRSGRCDGAHCQDWDAAKLWLPESLQGRHSLPGAPTSNRGGRREPLLIGKAAPRPQEDGIPGIVRVDSVEVHERPGDVPYADMRGDGYVYNIEVERFNNYFAEGVLVHNCHHVVAGTWAKIIESAPSAFHIGLTATPCRLDGRGLGAHYDAMLCGPPVADLIRDGFLSDYEVFAPTLASPKGLHVRAGDYARNEAAALMDNPTITGDAVSHYKRLAMGKRAIVFCTSIKHSKAVAQQFCANGIVAEHVDGDTPREDRLRIMDAFRAGHVRVVSNVDLFGEGVDVPAIEAVILLRPTKSLGLYMQQVGRALRPSPGKKHAIVIDHVNAVWTHGLPDDPHEWTLNGVDPGPKKQERALSVKICPKCFRAVRAVVRVCECGHAFVAQAREIDQRDGELSRVDKERARRERQASQGLAKSLEDLEALGMQRYGPKGLVWARIVWSTRKRKREVV